MTAPAVQAAHRFRPPGAVIMLGAGAVGQCLLEVLFGRGHLDMPLSRLVIADARDRRAELRRWLDGGALFAQAEITRTNLRQTVQTLAGAGDLIIDLTYDVSTIEMIEAARQVGALYVNASVEDWDDTATVPPPPSLLGLSLYQSHTDLDRAAARFPRDSPTAILSRGANPGAVSDLTRAALEDLADQVLKQLGGGQGLAPARQAQIEEYQASGEHGRLAEALGVELIQVSEHDTQVSAVPRRRGEFVCTWSPLACFKEALWLPAEIAMGTHEDHYPWGAQPHPNGPGIVLNRPGADVLVRSWAPQAGSFLGVCIAHDETIRLANYLTVHSESGRRRYGPTLHYAYGLPADTIASIDEARSAGYQMLPHRRVLAGADITSGADELGVALWGHDLNGWWHGSQAGIAESAALVPGHGPTTMQVAGSLLAGIGWAIEHPKAGVRHPEDLDHRWMLAVEGRYWEPMVGVQSGWDPAGDIAAHPFAAYSQHRLRPGDRWRFAETILAN